MSLERLCFVNNMTSHKLLIFIKIYTSSGRMLLTVIPSLLGTYHIGELHARSCIVEGKSSLGFSPDFNASHVDHRHVGFSKTLT